MELSESWKNRNQTQTNQNIFCFVDDGLLIHRKISHYLSVKDIPNDWNILSLYEPEKQAEQITEKTHYYKIDRMSNCRAYFIKKQFLEKVNIALSKDNNLDRLSVINQLLTEPGGKMCYVFRIPLVRPMDRIFETTYYEYYDEANKWDQLIIECKKKIHDNISIRHQLAGLLRYSEIKELQHILDHKLGFDEWIVNELITMSTITLSEKKDNDILEMETIMKNKTKIQSHNSFFDKSIINIFFDKYIYEELPICVVIPSFNNELYCEKNILSTIDQKYSNFRIIYIDDQSTDQTYELVKKTVLSKNQSNRTELMRQFKHGAQCCGRFMGYMMTDDDEIICNLDGDDFLYDRDDVHKLKALKYVESGYLKGLWSTYGCFYKSSGPQWMETTQTYPVEVIEKKMYRTHKFLCKHLRTGYSGLYKNIKIDDLMGPDGKFLHMCTDIATQYPVCEMAGNLHANLLVPTYIYNQDNSVMYNNSWYNLEKKDNEENKKYFDYVVEKIKTTKQYDTLNSYMTSKYHNFNMWENTMDIVLLGLNAMDTKYYLSKFRHEIGNTIKYNVFEVQYLYEYFSNISEKSDLVLFIDIDSTRIESNLNPKKYMKWLELKGYVLLDDQIDVSNGSYCMDEGSAYDIIITKTKNNDSVSGYYAKHTFEKLVINNDNRDNSSYNVIARPKNRMTVIVALYGIKKEWLEIAIDSMTKQTNYDWNLLICDDGTTNLEYKRMITSYLYDLKYKILGQRMRIIENNNNVGLAGTNKNMVGHVESKFIGSLDPDDALTDDAIQKIINVYMTDKDADFVYSNFYYCDQDLEIKSKGYAKPLDKNKLVIFENCISAFRTYKKSSYHHTLGYDPSFRSAEDKDIILKFEESGAKFVMVQEQLYKYRYNPGSLARTSDGSDAFNNHKTLQYCRNAIKQSHFRRFENNKFICDKPIDEIFIKYGMKNIIMTSYEKYFDDYFDMVYCVNLQSRPDKFDEMKIKLHLAGIKKVKFMRFKMAKDYPQLYNVYQAVTNNGLVTMNEKRENKKIIQSIGELGCSESHMYCTKDALKNGYKKILVLEDDVYFHKHFLIKFKEYSDQVPVDWQFLMLGASQWSWWGNAPFLKKNLYHPTRASMGTFAVAINVNLMQGLINNLSTYDSPADLGGYSKSVVNVKLTENVHSTIFLHEKRYPIMHCHVFYPNIIIADTTDSSLRDGDIESKFLSRCLHMDWQIDNMMMINNRNSNSMKKFLDNISCDTMNEILVDDYDSIYPDISINQEPIELIIDNELPYKVHQILTNSRNNKIIIKGDIDNSNYAYYKKRIEHFPNIVFVE